MADEGDSAHRVQRRVRRRERRSRILLASCLAALVAIGGIVLWSLGSDSDDSTADVPTPAATTPVPDEADRSAVLPASFCGEPAPSLAVFLLVDVTDADSNAIRAHLESIPDATEVTYIDQDAAYDEFEELFWDSPEMLDSVEPEDLPASFRLGLSDSDPESTAAELMSLPGVNDAVVNPCQPGSRDRTVDDQSSEPGAGKGAQKP